MKVPPNRIRVEVSEENVQNNLAAIVNGMDSVRNASLASLEIDDTSKLDYLRFAHELASCIEPKLRDVNAEGYAQRIAEIIGRDPLLLRYDDIQRSFWERRQPKFRDLLDRAAILLLRDNFNSTSQAYHIFQGVKYLSVNQGNQEKIYDTILPFNSLLSEAGLGDPLIAQFVMLHLFQGYMQQAGNGLVLGKNDIHSPEFIDRLRELGALHVDLPQAMYSRMKAKYPKTIVIEEGKEKRARVFLRDLGEKTIGANMFDFFVGYAQKELSDKAERSLKHGIRFHFSFGKDFVAEMGEEMGLIAKPEPKHRSDRDVILTLDDVAAENSVDYTQDEWTRHYNTLTDGRFFPSMKDFFQWARQAKDNPEEYKDVLASLRKDFKGRRLLLSTRINYDGDSGLADIIHRYGSKMQEELIHLEVPVYRDKPLAEVLAEDKGRQLMYAFLGASDQDDIVEVLGIISGMPEKDLRVWTPILDGQYSRARFSARAASLSYADGHFHVNGDSGLNDSGRSRGVRYASDSER